MQSFQPDIPQFANVPPRDSTPAERHESHGKTGWIPTSDLTGDPAGDAEMLEPGPEQLLAGLLAADRLPADLAAELDLRPRQLLAIIESHQLAETCESWRSLNEQRTAMLLSQLRAGAAVRLAQFLAGDDSETVRKACVDLLRAGTTTCRAASRAARGQEPQWPGPPSAAVEAAVLAELARIGRAELADHDSASNEDHPPQPGRDAGPPA